MSLKKHPFGWRRRIGLSSPTVIEMISYDFYRLAPAGVDLCAVTSNIEFWDKDHFTRSLDAVLESAAYLASRNVDFIVHCGMPLVTTRGKGFEDELVRQITEKTGLGATTSIRSAIRGLRHIGIRNVAIASPYPQELHQSAVTFLGESGFNVVAHGSLDVPFKALQDASPEQIYAHARRVVKNASATVEGIYIPCNQWAAADAVPLIEADLGIPVVTGAHADFWEAFRSVGVRDVIEGHGVLMRSLADMPR